MPFSGVLRQGCYILNQNMEHQGLRPSTELDDVLADWLVKVDP